MAQAGTDEFGPTGIAFLESGEWLVANGGTGELFRLERVGVTAGTPIAPHAGLMDLTFGSDGDVYDTRWAHGDVVQIDPATGAIKRTVHGNLDGPRA